MIRCHLCGEPREPAEVLEFVHSRTGVIRYACRPAVGPCVSRTISRVGPSPSVGGRWQLRRVDA
jgi:hypothetical protein